MTEYFERTKRSTTTTILLLPAIGLSRRSLLKYGFLNAYLDDSSHDVHYERAVYILFRPESWDKFNVHLEREQQSENFITSYDYAGGYIVLVYSILDKYSLDYQKFLKGMYSSFSQEYKETFPTSVRVLNESGLEESVPSTPWHIFEKSVPMREFWERELETKLDPDQEVWLAPNIEKETLDIDSIRLTVKDII